nr:MAG TPA: hypothetical protein [Caudoviricetes sp.]
MKVSEQIAIMKAYEDGKPIERKDIDETEWKSLEYVENYPFDFVANEYRIKPEYRPFKTIKEAFDEGMKHGFFVKKKYNQFQRMIVSLDNCERENLIYINGQFSSEYLNNFVWADDGSPCGVKIG